MRYPVNNFKEQWNTTAGYSFAAKTSYGYHDGCDLNKNGGGNIELGEPIFAIAKGRLEYYHKGSHPTKNFGYHSIYKIEGPWGVRWVHNAHLTDSLLTGVQDITEGQQIGQVGNSGTTYAHDHFAIFKVDPATLPQGIDTIASTAKQLNDWWEDPIAFIEKWMNFNPTPQLPQLVIKDDTRIPQIDNKMVQEIKVELRDAKLKLKEYEDAGYTSIQKIKDIIEGHQSRATTLENERNEARANIEIEKSKAKQAKEELALKIQECQTRESSLLAQIEELKKDDPDLQKVVAEYETQIAVLKDSESVLQGKLNNAVKELAKLKTPFKNLNFIERVKLLFV